MAALGLGPLPILPHSPRRTDFSGGAAPKLAVASIDQMVSLNPNDIFTKLKSLAAIVFSLFGMMLIASSLAYVSDKRYYKKLMATLCTSQFGFKVEDKGGWTWFVQQVRSACGFAFFVPP